MMLPCSSVRDIRKRAPIHGRLCSRRNADLLFKVLPIQTETPLLTALVLSNFRAATTPQNTTSECAVQSKKYRLGR